jgi:hypothetical protein
MWRGGRVAVAAVAMLAAGGGADAATEAEFDLASTGDLVDQARQSEQRAFQQGVAAGRQGG